MPTFEVALHRGLEGLADRSGRTLVVVGPPGSGKTAVLGSLDGRVEALGGRTVRLRGAYRDRAVPFGALEGLDRTGPEPESADLPGDERPLGDSGAVPMAPIPLDPEALPGSRRRDGRVRSSFLGGPSRARGPPSRNADDYWMQLLPEFRGEASHPVALLLDDVVFFDIESREFVIELSQRARLRPLLIVLALDSSASTASVWEEALLGRPDVDWLRLPAPTQDPRESHRLRELLDRLATPTGRVLGYVAMLGGDVSEVILARIARLSLPQLREAVKPATEVKLLRARDGRVALQDRSTLPILEGLLPPEDVSRWHLDIAEGLEALSAEPSLRRRVEIAQHYLAVAPDAVAMGRLFEAAEISLGLLEFDEASRLLADAFRCLRATRATERGAIEPEMHFEYARALFYGGCPAEAEAQLRDGVEGAIASGRAATDVASWIEPLLPVLQIVGPRRELGAAITQLAQRLRDGGLTEPEVLFETVLPAYRVERRLLDRARADALRAAQNARRMRERHLQALGLFAMGVARSSGSSDELDQAGRFLGAARYLFRQTRRWELDYIAGEYECRTEEARGRVDQALAVRQQSIAALERARLPSVELLHHLGIAQTLLDRDAPSSADRSLDRALRLSDSLHLLPPSPGLLRAWLLEGRRFALAGSTGPARDRWQALVDLPPEQSLPRLRVEALLRLALLETAVGRTEEARYLTEELGTDEMRDSLPRAWRGWPRAIADHAPESHHGGGPLPPVAPVRGGP